MLIFVKWTFPFSGLVETGPCNGNGCSSNSDHIHSMENMANRSWKCCDENVSVGWMYEWMLELYHLVDFYEASDIQTDLSQSFSFRDSKIHILKKIRRKLHVLEENMVCFIHFPLFALSHVLSTACMENTECDKGECPLEIQ